MFVGCNCAALQPEIYGSWCFVVKAHVRPGVVVELEVVAQASLSLLDVLVGIKENVLVLDRAPQPLCEEVFALFLWLW